MKISVFQRSDFQLSEAVLKSNLPILIQGETGTGKTCLARAIHEFRFPNFLRPIVEVNLASLHEGTIESELFGHEVGAFTGANVRKIGKLELAQGGTVFFDEIAELSIELQARLLQFLDSRKIYRMGSNQPIIANVRIIAATQRNLKEWVAKGKFREDLYFRLKGAEVELCPLRFSSGDFGEKMHEVLEDICTTEKRKLLRIESSLAEMLEAYSWPGNFRELKQCLTYAITNCDSEILNLKSMPIWFQSWAKGFLLGSSVSSTTLGMGLPFSETLQGFMASPDFSYNKMLLTFEKGLLTYCLEKNRWSFRKTALFLKMPKATLYRRWLRQVDEPLTESSKGMKQKKVSFETISSKKSQNKIKKVLQRGGGRDYTLDLSA